MKKYHIYSIDYTTFPPTKQKINSTELFSNAVRYAMIPVKDKQLQEDANSKLLLEAEIAWSDKEQHENEIIQQVVYIKKKKKKVKVEESDASSF